MTAGTMAAGRADTRAADAILAVLVGLAAFLAIVGPKVLDVTNMLWLTTQKDTFTHYLGWEFFRRSPLVWPPGLNPDYGLQFSSSILFSDSIPLLAIPLKLLSPILPETFQYTGWWTLGCFILQAYFAARLAGLVTSDFVVKLGVAALLAFAPPFLWRLELHFSLIAHWIVLAAIWLYFTPGRAHRSVAWGVLLTVSALVHTYCLAMCLPIWLASLVDRRRDPATSAPWPIELVAVLAAVLAALWLAGFFPLRSSLLTFGYGMFSLNLLALINPNGSFTGPWSWSSILPMLPQGGGQYEGFNYLGLGGIVAVALALPIAWIDRARYAGARLLPLVLAAIALTLFAISPMVTIADLQAVIPVPDFIYAMAGSVRASGRFFWPVFYLVPLAAVWLIHRRFGAAMTGPLLLILTALQIYDTYPGWSWFRSKFEMDGAVWQTSLSDPRLAPVARHYRAVRALPAANQVPGWNEIAYFALRNHLPTDTVYLARPNDAAYAQYDGSLDQRTAAHVLDRDSIYFVAEDYAGKVEASMSDEDAMFRVGKFYVFAPGWRSFGMTTDLPLAGGPAL
jgi:hypothetical protein